MIPERDRKPREVLLDGSVIDSPEHLHRILKQVLELPDDYGNNLDALWDCLTGWVPLPLTVRWLHFKESEQKLGNYGRQLLQLFRDAEKELDGFQLRIE